MYEIDLSEFKPIKVLHVFQGMNSGGVESFVINLFNSLNDQSVHFDFLLRSTHNDKEKINFFRKRGCHIYYMADWPLNYWKNSRETKAFFRKYAGKYDVIHIHANALIYMLPVKLSAKFMNQVKVIVHSHNTRPLSPYIRPIHCVNRIRMKKYDTINLACSEKAGRWMFQKAFCVIPNGIDVSKFRPQNHQSIKSELRLVSVGRLEKQKNYEFMIPVIKSLVNRGLNVTYKIAGEGSLRGKLEAEIVKYELSGKIRLLGNCHDITGLLEESDIFLMPSLYEGLSIAHLEAQCKGISCILSDTIPREGCVTDNVHRLPLVRKRWVDTILEVNNEEDREFRAENYQSIVKSEFGLEALSQKMLKIYRTGNVE